ncbi:MAG: hypothetical protein JWL72_232, partial [Ilumatobacteraceae bacterium]|nr:hypothetical protein [Ilumatobacteraceae bacterium]
PRPARIDEYNSRTALVIRQSKTDFAASSDLGVGPHDTGVLTDLPVKNLSAVMKPVTWAYFVLDVERAFAIEWWLTMLGPFLGVYALMMVLTRSRLIAALTGLLVAASPALLWWSIPSSGFSVMYGAFTCALIIAAARATGRRRFLWTALGGWTAAGFATMLYLPWLIPLTLLFGAIAISQMPNVLVQWKRLLTAAVAFGGVFGLLMAIYLRDHHAALSSIANSVYPGNRVTPAGEALPELVFDAPYDVFTTSRQYSLIAGTNQSEAASGLMLWLPIAIVGGAFAGFRTRSKAARALTASMIVSVVLAAWALLPIPAKVGSLLGLTNVQGSRVALPLAVAGLISGGLFVQRIRDDPAFRPSVGRAVLGAAAFAALTGWVIRKYTIDSVEPSRRSMLLLLVVFSVAVFVVMRGKALVGLGSMCVLTLFGSVRINPIQIGLGPILDNPLTLQIGSVRAGHESERWAAVGEAGHAPSILMASGAPTVTGTDWYANTTAWHRIDPTDSSSSIWNRFAQIWIVVDDAVPSPTLELRYNDLIVIHTASCAGALQDFDVTYVTSESELSSPCLRPLAPKSGPGERWIYQVVPAA